MPTALYAVSLAAGGVSISKSVSRASDGPIALETLLAAGKPVTSWVKTTDTAATCDLPAGHGYANGTFDVFWPAGRRYNVTGTIITNALTLASGGGGDVFPASATAGVVVCRNVAASLLIDGDNVDILGIVAEASDPNSTARAHVTLEDAAGDDITLLDLVANVPQIWDIAGGSANPFVGDVIVSVVCGVEAALTIKIVGMQDATP